MEKDYKELYLETRIRSLKMESQLLKDRFHQVQMELIQTKKNLKEYLNPSKESEGNEKTD